MYYLLVFRNHWIVLKIMRKQVTFFKLRDKYLHQQMWQDDKYEIGE